MRGIYDSVNEASVSSSSHRMESQGISGENVSLQYVSPQLEG